MASKEKYILAIDLGTSGPKVSLFSSQGEMLGSEFEETKLLLFPDGGAEQSPDEWWDAIQKAAKRIARGLTANEDIIAVACTGQWSGTVPLDADGNALGNAIIWMDSRGGPQIHQIAGGTFNNQGYAPVKLLQWIQRTGGAPAIAGKDPIAHILYLKQSQPDSYQQTFKFLEPIDYIGLRLTGRFAASFDSITLHWLTDNRDINNGRYDDRLLRFSNIPA